jgi:hypothetical protein
MNLDVEDLLRAGLERFAEQVPVPTGLAHKAARAHRRRMAIRAAAGVGAAAITAAVALAATSGAGGAMQARTTAYMVSRVENALASQHLVFRGQTTTTLGPSVSWVYGPRHRFEELGGNGSQPYLDLGTALIGGKLTNVYVAYYAHTWSLLPEPIPASACSRTGALEMGTPVPTSNWPAFIHATLACGAAAVTGHARIDGMDTLTITGSPVSEKLPAKYAKAIREKWLQARWILYVNPRTYLPVRLASSARTYGGPAPSFLFTSVTHIQWLPPTAANIAKALITIPPGYRRVSSPANQ